MDGGKSKNPKFTYVFPTPMDNLKTPCKLFSPEIVMVILSRYLFLKNPFKKKNSGHLIVLLRYRNNAVLVTDTNEE